jgi:hypothetical protein
MLLDIATAMPDSAKKWNCFSFLFQLIIRAWKMPTNQTGMCVKKCQQSA